MADKMKDEDRTRKMFFSGNPGKEQLEIEFFGNTNPFLNIPVFFEIKGECIINLHCLRLKNFEK